MAILLCGARCCAPSVMPCARPSTERHNTVVRARGAAHWPSPSRIERRALEHLRLKQARAQGQCAQRRGGTLSALADGEAWWARPHRWEEPPVFDGRYPARERRPALRLEADWPRADAPPCLAYRQPLHAVQAQGEPDG